MLDLDAAVLVGKGLHRECYEYPGDSTRCVKVVVAGNSDENRREARYYQRLARRRISWELLSNFHGLEPTSMGEGAVFDLVRDFDGCVSQTLGHYLESPALSANHEVILAGAFAELKGYLLRNRVVTMTLKSKNILLQKTTQETGKLVIVDNVGNSDFIPLSNYIGCLARRKILRKWRRFEQDIQRQNPNNAVLQRVLARNVTA